MGATSVGLRRAHGERVNPRLHGARDQRHLDTAGYLWFQSTLPARRDVHRRIEPPGRLFFSNPRPHGARRRLFCGISVTVTVFQSTPARARLMEWRERVKITNLFQSTHTARARRLFNEDCMTAMAHPRTRTGRRKWDDDPASSFVSSTYARTGRDSRSYFLHWNNYAKRSSPALYLRFYFNHGYIDIIIYLNVTLGRARIFIQFCFE